MRQRSLEEQARQGESIARLLTDPDIRETLREVDERYIAEWKSPESTPTSRESVWYKSQALHDLLQELERVVNEGVFARGTLDRQERQAP